MDADRGREIEMIVESVRVHMPTGRHVLVLREMDRGRLLMIWVGPWEASAIAMKLQGLTPERPLTHDLFVTVLGTLGARVERIVITDLADETFHARILLNRSGDRSDVDARPSDAIALAVRLGIPVYASSEVLDRAATTPGEDEEADDTAEDDGSSPPRRRPRSKPEPVSRRRARCGASARAHSRPSSRSAADTSARTRSAPRSQAWWRPR